MSRPSLRAAIPPDCPHGNSHGQYYALIDVEVVVYDPHHQLCTLVKVFIVMVCALVPMLVQALRLTALLDRLRQHPDYQKQKHVEKLLVELDFPKGTVLYLHQTPR